MILDEYVVIKGSNRNITFTQYYINNIFRTLGAQRQNDNKSQFGSIIYNF